MAQWGELFENDGQLTVMPSWFNNIFRFLMLYVRAGLACAEDSLCGKIYGVLLEPTRVYMHAPDTAAGEFVYSAGQFMNEVHQLYVDFGNIGINGVDFEIYIDAYRNAAAAQPRYEIWLRAHPLTLGNLDPNEYAVVGVVHWDGVNITWMPTESLSLRLRSVGIFGPMNKYYGPLHIRENERITLADGIHAGADPVPDPDMLTGPTDFKAFLGMLADLAFGKYLQLMIGSGSFLEVYNSAIAFRDSCLFALIDSQLSLYNSTQRYDQKSSLVFTSNAFLGTSQKNQMHVEHIPKVCAYVDATGALVEGFGVASVVHLSGFPYSINFTWPFANTDYRVHVTQDDGEAVLATVVRHVGQVVLTFRTDPTDPLTGTNTAFSVEIKGKLA